MDNCKTEKKLSTVICGNCSIMIRHLPHVAFALDRIGRNARIAFAVGLGLRRGARATQSVPEGSVASEMFSYFLKLYFIMMTLLFGS